MAGAHGGVDVSLNDTGRFFNQSDDTTSCLRSLLVSFSSMRREAWSQHRLNQVRVTCWQHMFMGVLSHVPRMLEGHPGKDASGHPPGLHGAHGGCLGPEQVTK